MWKHLSGRHLQVHRRCSRHVSNDRNDSPYRRHHLRQRLPSSPLFRLSARSPFHHPSSARHDRLLLLCVLNAVVADVIRAKSLGTCLQRGFAIIIAFARRTQSLITPLVCAASKVYFITVQMTLMGESLVRTIHAGVVLIKGQLGGAVLRHFRVCYRVYCVIGRYKPVNDSSKRVTPGILVKVVDAPNSQLLRRGCWIPARTSNREYRSTCRGLSY